MNNYGVSLGTQGSPGNAAGTETQTGNNLFPRARANPGDTTTYSAVFTVTDKPVLLRAFGFGINTVATLQMVYGSGSTQRAEDFALDGGSYTLTQSSNLLPVTIEGRYRVALTGADPMTVVVSAIQIGLDYTGLKTGDSASTLPQIFFDVRRAGAKADGTGNASPAFTNSATLGTVYVPDGVFNIDTPPAVTTGYWWVSPRTTFTGAGRRNGIGLPDTGYLDMKRGFWLSDPNGVNIHRLTDRVFVGGATLQSGAFLDAIGLDRTWLGFEASGFMSYVDVYSQFQVISSVGQIAGSFATRTSDQVGTQGASSPTGGAAIALLAYARADRPGKPAWASYMHGARDIDGGPLVMWESDVAQLKVNATLNNPFFLGTEDLTANVWIGSGGETALGQPVYAASTAIGIFNNGAPYQRGIIVGYNAIEGTDGFTGYAPFALLGNRQGIEWWGASNDFATRVANSRLYSDAGTTYSGSLVFRATGLEFLSLAGNAAFRASQETANANGLWIRGAVAGLSPELVAMGETNTGIVLRTLGTGAVTAITDGINARNAAGSSYFQAYAIPSNANGIAVFGGQGAIPPSFNATGTETNVGLALITKGNGDITLRTSGTGRLRFGTFVALAGAADSEVEVLADNGVRFALLARFIP